MSPNHFTWKKRRKKRKRRKRKRMKKRRKWKMMTTESVIDYADEMIYLYLFLLVILHPC